MFDTTSTIYVSNRADVRAILNYFGITPFFQPDSTGVAPCQRKRVKQRGSYRYDAYTRNRGAFARAQAAVVDSAVAAASAVTKTAPVKATKNFFRNLRNFFAKIWNFLFGWISFRNAGIRQLAS